MMKFSDLYTLFLDGKRVYFASRSDKCLLRQLVNLTAVTALSYMKMDYIGLMKIMMKTMMKNGNDSMMLYWMSIFNLLFPKV